MTDLSEKIIKALKYYKYAKTLFCLFQIRSVVQDLAELKYRGSTLYVSIASKFLFWAEYYW